MAELVGNFSGSSLVPDPVTGFLTSPRHLIKSNNAVDLDVKDVKTGLVSDVKDVRPDRDSAGKWLVGHGGVFVEPTFDHLKKTEFLKLYSEMFPNYAGCLEILDISSETYKNHLQVDISFKKAVDEVQAKHVCQINAVRFQAAKTIAGAYDRDRLLYGYMPEVYNPKTTIEVKHTMTREQALDGVRRMESAVDAEVVETVKRLKASRKA